MRIDKALRAIASQRHLTQAELCRRTGINSGQMSMYFNNKVRHPEITYLYVIAHDGLHVSLDDFVKLAIHLDNDHVFSPSTPLEGDAGSSHGPVSSDVSAS